jgi:hypothetical protein
MCVPVIGGLPYKSEQILHSPTDIPAGVKMQ